MVGTQDYGSYKSDIYEIFEAVHPAPAAPLHNKDWNGRGWEGCQSCCCSRRSARHQPIGPNDKR